MAKKKKKHHQSPRNIVHLCMVEQHKSVAHKSEKDYDRQKSKQDTKNESDQYQD